MVSFRRCILALTVLALFAGLASAQITGGGGSNSGMTCQLLPQNPTLMRAEGATELAADLVISCTSTGDAPTSGSVPTATIMVNLSASVTSRVLRQL